MEFPDNLKYTTEHEWVRLKGNVATLGITEYAQEQLGDIVYVELPEVGQELEKDEPFGVVESVKAVSDVYSPVTGKITEVNDSLTDSADTVNEDCYEEGWLVRVEVSNKKELDDLMDNKEYEAFVKEQAS